jgi:hypothetical protein
MKLYLLLYPETVWYFESDELLVKVCVLTAGTSSTVINSYRLFDDCIAGSFASIIFYLVHPRWKYRRGPANGLAVCLFLLALCNAFTNNFFAHVLHFEVEAWDEYELVDVSCCDVYADGGLYGSSFTLQVRQFALLPTSDLTVYHLMSLWSHSSAATQGTPCFVAAAGPYPEQLKSPHNP